MSVSRMLRARLAEIEAHGLAIAGVKFGKHIKIDLVAPDGRVMMLVVSKTPSDHRAAAKVRSQLRRFARLQASS
jgi:hypothetical protein